MSGYNDLEIQEQLMNQLEEMQQEISRLQAEVSEKDSLLLKAVDRAEMMSQQLENSSEVQELRNEILQKSETISSLNARIGMLAESDNVLQQNKELQRQNEQLKKEKQAALDHATTEVSAVKAEYQSKAAALESAKKSATAQADAAQTLRNQLSDEINFRAALMIRDRISQLNSTYAARKAALTSYVAISGVLAVGVSILSLIRQKTFWGDFRAFWGTTGNIIALMAKNVLKGVQRVSGLSSKIPQPTAAAIVYWLVFVVLFVLLAGVIVFGGRKLYQVAAEPVSEGVDPWNVSVAALLLLLVVFFGDYVKRFIGFNLFGMWCIAAIVLLGIGMFRNRSAY